MDKPDYFGMSIAEELLAMDEGERAAYRTACEQRIEKLSEQLSPEGHQKLIEEQSRRVRLQNAHNLIRARRKHVAPRQIRAVPIVAKERAIEIEGRLAEDMQAAKRAQELANLNPEVLKQFLEESREYKHRYEERQQQETAEQRMAVNQTSCQKPLSEEQLANRNFYNSYYADMAREVRTLNGKYPETAEEREQLDNRNFYNSYYAQKKSELER